MQRKPAMLALLVFFLLVVLTCGAAAYLWHSDSRTSEIRARTVAQQVSNALEIMAADRVRALDDLTGQWPISIANPVDWFNVRAVTLKKMLPGLNDLLLLDEQQRLLWSTDPTVRRLYLQQPFLQMLKIKALPAGLVLLYPPDQPRQLMVLRHISAHQTWRGTVALVFDISSILSVYTAELPSGGLSYRVSDGELVLQQQGEFRLTTPTASQQFSFAGRDWVLQVQDQVELWQLPLSTVLIGLLLSALVSVLWYRQLIRDAQVRAFQQLYQSAADASLDAMLLFATVGETVGGVTRPRDFMLQQHNQVATELFEPALLLSGQLLSRLCQHLQAERFFQICQQVATSGAPYEQVVRNQNPALKAQWLRLQVVRSAQGLAMTFRDVSSEQQLVQQIRFQAEHDQLTGLFNRYAFERRLTQLTAQPQPTDSTELPVPLHTGALCYIDMDQFKQINDSCGHLAGDELLRQVASILATDLTSKDMLARVGGDEFCLLLTQRTMAEVEICLQLLLQRISVFRFCWDQQVFTIGASIGVVDLQRYQGSTQELLKAADNGCYLAKHQGRNRYLLVDANTAELNHLQQQRQLVSYLRQALEQNSFALYAQPIVPLSVQSAGMQYEILLRLTDPQGQLLNPAVFIPLAEQSGLMGHIDRWVIRQVLAQLAANPRHVSVLDKVAINLSGASLSDPELLNYIRQQLKTYAVPAGKLCFEITETAAITNLAAARQLIAQLRAIGCRFALDDFGAGMSSFAYLRELKVDYLKIDGSFVKQMTQQATDAVMVRAMAEIARSLQMETIAEFVPDEATCVLLRSIGVQYGQGYALGKPAPWQLFFDSAAA